MYHNAGFKVKKINADNAFRSLQEQVSKYNIKMNLTSAQEHVPEAENNNRRIKERVRATYHLLKERGINVTYGVFNRAIFCH